MKKDIVVRTEKEFLEALKNIDENTIIIFDDGEPLKIDVREFNIEKNRRLNTIFKDYYSNRLKTLKLLKKAVKEID